MTPDPILPSLPAEHPSGQVDAPDTSVPTPISEIATSSIHSPDRSRWMLPSPFAASSVITVVDEAKTLLDEACEIVGEEKVDISIFDLGRLAVAYVTHTDQDAELKERLNQCCLAVARAIGYGEATADRPRRRDLAELRDLASEDPAAAAQLVRGQAEAFKVDVNRLALALNLVGDEGKKVAREILKMRLSLSEELPQAAELPAADQRDLPEIPAEFIRTVAGPPGSDKQYELMLVGQKRDAPLPEEEYWEIAPSIIIKELPAPGVKKPCGTFKEFYLAADSNQAKPIAFMQLKEGKDAAKDQDALFREMERQRVVGEGNPNVGEALLTTHTGVSLQERLGAEALTRIVQDTPNGRLPNSEAVAHLAREIGAGLKSLHEKRLIHLDLKLENILESYPNLPLEELVERGQSEELDRLIDRFSGESAQAVVNSFDKAVSADEVREKRLLLEALAPHQSWKIIDFGFVEEAPEGDGIVHLSTGKGTPFYVAPELLQLKNHQASIKSDTYSFGVMLFMAKYGYAPFVGENQRELLRAHLLRLVNYDHDRKDYSDRLLAARFRRTLDEIGKPEIDDQDRMIFWMFHPVAEFRPSDEEINAFFAEGGQLDPKWKFPGE